MIKAVLFDYGGVIKVHYSLSKNMAEICGVSDGELERTKEERFEIGRQLAKGFISNKQFWQKIGDILGKPISDNSVELAKKFYRENFAFLPGMMDLVKELRARKIKTAVLSNIGRLEAKVIREKNGYKGFDALILSYEAGMAKPEVDIYLLAAKKLRVRPDECIFIDDAEKNLVPAEKLGMKTVLFKNPKQATRDILKLF